MKDRLRGAIARVLGASLTFALASCTSTTSSHSLPDAGANAQPAKSFIVEGDSIAGAERPVLEAGGSVVSRLGIIDAVEANLTEAERARVLASSGIRQVSPNATVSTQAAAANVRDNFEFSGFSNDDGSHRWYGSWVEAGDNRSPYNGKISVGWLDRGGKRLVLSGSGASLSRKVATPTTSTVQLKFKALRAGFEAGEYVAIQASANGTTFTEVGRISGAGTDAGFVDKTFDISAYRGRNTTIRFVPSMSGQYGDDCRLVDH